MPIRGIFGNAAPPRRAGLSSIVEGQAAASPMFGKSARPSGHLMDIGPAGAESEITQAELERAHEIVRLFREARLRVKS